MPCWPCTCVLSVNIRLLTTKMKATKLSAKMDKDFLFKHKFILFCFLNFSIRLTTSQRIYYITDICREIVVSYVQISYNSPVMTVTYCIYDMTYESMHLIIRIVLIIRFSIADTLVQTSVLYMSRQSYIQSMSYT